MRVTLHEGQYTFMIIYCSVPLRMKNASEKNHRESPNTHLMFNNFVSKIMPFMR